MTRGETIKRLKEARNTIQPFRYVDEAIDYAIQALEQEPILDKIKEEIKDNTYFINETTEKEGIDFETVEKIIDKYKVERSNTE